MKKLSFLALAAAALVLPCAPAKAAAPGKSRVMIVVVAHLVAKHDVHNSVFTDSPLCPPLGANEIYQFGFRLAAKSGHAAIYPIDTWGPSIYDDASASGKRIDAYPTANMKDIKDAPFDRFVARSAQIERSGTYLGLLRYMNTDAAIRANAP